MAYIYKLSKKVPNSRLVVIILLRCHFQSFIDVHFPGVQPHAVNQVDITFFEVRAHLKSILPSRQLRLDLDHALLLLAALKLDGWDMRNTSLPRIGDQHLI